MAKRGSNEVGRVSIRVVPDTNGFRQRLKAGIEAASRGMTAEIPLELDVRQAQAAAKRLSNSLQNINIGDGLNMNLRRTEQALGNAVARASQLSQRLRQAAASTVDFARRAANISGHFRRMGQSVTGLGQRIRAIKMRGLYENAIRTGDAFFRMKDRVDRVRGSLGRLVAAGAIKGLRALRSAAENASFGIGRLGHTGWMIVAVFSAAAPVIGLVAGLLAGLPSLAFAGGAAIAAIALGMDGIKKAAKVLQPEINRLKKSLSDTFAKGLTPVFRRLKSIFPTLQTGLNQVARGLIVVADGFADVVTSGEGMRHIRTILAGTRNLFVQLVPFFKQGTMALLRLGAAGAQSFGHLSKMLNNWMTNFNAMVKRVTSNGLFDRAMKGLAATTGAILNLFNILFEEGLKAIAKLGGPLANFVNGFGSGMRGLMPILTSLTAVLANVLGAALKALGPILQALQPFIQAFADSLQVGLLAIIQKLSPLLLNLAEMLSRNASWLGPLAAGIMGAVAAFKILNAVMRMNPFIAIASAVIFLTVLIVDNWDHIKAFLLASWNWIRTTAITVWNAIRNFFVTVWNGIVAVGRAIWNGLSWFFTGLWNGIRTVAMTVWHGIRAFFVGVWNGIVAVGRAIWNGLRWFFTNLWNGIRIIAITVWNGIRAFFVGAWNGIVAVGRAIWNGLRWFFSNLWNGIRAVAIAVWNGIRGFLAGAWRGIVAVGRAIWNGLRWFFGNLWNGIRAVAIAVWNGIRGFLVGLWRGVSGVARAIWNGVRAFFGGVWRGIRAVAVAVWNGIRNFLVGLWRGVAGVARAVWNGVRNFLAGLWRGISRIARSVWNGVSNFLRGVFNGIGRFIRNVWNGIRHFFNTVWAGIKAIFSRSVNNIRSVISSVWNWVRRTTSGAWNAIKNAVSSGVSRVVHFVWTMPGRILRALGNLGSLLWNAGASLISGLWNGIKSVWNKMTGWVKGGLNKIRNLFPFSPAKEGPFSGHGYTLYSGRALITDFGKGMLDSFPKIKHALEGELARLNNTMTDSAFYFDEKAALREIDGFMRGVSNQATAQWEGHISADDFGAVGDRVSEALAGWELRIDPNGMLKLVEKAQIRKGRRT